MQTLRFKWEEYVASAVTDALSAALIALPPDEVIDVGIDPGATGAIAIVSRSYQLIAVIDMPIIKRKVKKTRAKVKRKTRVRSQLDLPKIIAIFKTLEPYRTRINVVIEKVPYKVGIGPLRIADCVIHSMYAVWLMYLYAQFPGVTEVTPQMWKTYHSLLKTEKTESIAKAVALFPNVEQLLARKKDHNRAEALLITAWKKHHD